MKHFFLLEWVFTAPLEQIEAATPDHRAYLQTGYDKGMLLLSGPQIPRTAGIIIMRAESREAAEAFAHGDPYFTRQLAKARFVEFNPVKRQPILEDWVNG
jgi:uncharacterized protein YciI